MSFLKWFCPGLTRSSGHIETKIRTPPKKNLLSLIDLFGPATHGWSASASIATSTTCSARRLSSSHMSMASSSKRGKESMSGVGSGGISMAVFVLSQNLLMW